MCTHEIFKKRAVDRCQFYFCMVQRLDFLWVHRADHKRVHLDIACVGNMLIQVLIKVVAAVPDWYVVCYMYGNICTLEVSA